MVCTRVVYPGCVHPTGCTPPVYTRRYTAPHDAPGCVHRRSAAARRGGMRHRAQGRIVTTATDDGDGRRRRRRRRRRRVDDGDVGDVGGVRICDRIDPGVIPGCPRGALRGPGRGPGRGPWGQGGSGGGPGGVLEGVLRVVPGWSQRGRGGPRGSIRGFRGWIRGARGWIRGVRGPGWQKRREREIPGFPEDPVLFLSVSIARAYLS